MDPSRPQKTWAQTLNPGNQLIPSPSCHCDGKLVQLEAMEGWMLAETTGIFLHWDGSLLGYHPRESPAENEISKREKQS